ncbi:hypothetical protein [Methylobacterium isbiliense]|uniref:Uncharacterized protein n=1 Tax=Methylobacterium isbiliense TaxID=315478 RepID=A0ABQ4SL35_9HYPH|nr:hypothetical protein [Methylobacterium isbiliense]MDN3625288.1 hypothetical protein [Methylobacterium isbiliense]GJE03133.1 hypothetical protein GMJLKIPL_5084 [Methylobacterium isbiliense]
MPQNPKGPASRRRDMVLALASGMILVSTAVAVQAADDGFAGLFRNLFSAPAPIQAAPTAAPLPDAYGRPMRRLRRERSQARAALRARARYVALPKPEAAETKPVKVERPSGPFDPRTALLRDPTLRPGDIVILPEGPRVFKGESGAAKHRMSDFEDVSRSRTVSTKTRRDLMAMTAPAGALPADEARRVMARLRRGTQAAGSGEARTETAMRVIYPAR